MRANEGEREGEGEGCEGERGERCAGFVEGVHGCSSWVGQKVDVRLEVTSTHISHT